MNQKQNNVTGTGQPAALGPVPPTSSPATACPASGEVSSTSTTASPAPRWKSPLYALLVKWFSLVKTVNGQPHGPTDAQLVEANRLCDEVEQYFKSKRLPRTRRKAR